MKDDASTQGQPRPAALPEETTANAKPRFEAAKSRVASFLTAFTRKKKASSDNPSTTQDGTGRPVIESVRVALFLDSKGKIVAAHPRCAAYFGRQPGELSGLNLKDLIKPGFDQEVASILASGRANDQSFHVLALRKDGSEFATQFLFKSLQDFRFRWAVFVKAPPGTSHEADQPVSEPQAIAPTTETATTATPEPETSEDVPAPVVQSHPRNPERSAPQLQAGQNDRRIQHEEDSSDEPETNEPQSVGELQMPAGAGDAEARLRESMARCSEWEKKVSGLKKCVDELARRHASEQNAAIKAVQRVKELEAKLKRAGFDHAAGAGNDDQGDTRHRLKTANRNLSESDAKARAELDKEREAIKVSQKKEEVLQIQVQKLQATLEQAEARAHESAPQAKDWEKRAASLKKCVDELARRHATEQNAAIKAAQRVKELEEKLKRTADEQEVAKKGVDNQGDTRHRLKAENRNLIEANAKVRADLDKERETIKGFLKKEEELQAQVQKLQAPFEIAQGHARESAAQSRDWEMRAADLKKSVDELTRRHAAEQNSAVKAAQRVKELEQQLKRAGHNPVPAKKIVDDDQQDTRFRLKSENRNLTEANEKARAELDKERDAIKIAFKKEEELQTQVQNLQGALAQAEERARESATQSTDWEKRAADLKKSVDELAQKHAEQIAAVEAAQDHQVNHAEDDQTADKKDVEAQDATRQRLEAEIRNLIEASDRTKADLEKERNAIKVFLKKEGELQTQIQKLQGASEIAQAHARESAAQSKDWETKAADLKKSVDELTKSYAAEQSAAVISAQHVKELEEQLKRAGDAQAADHKDNQGQDDARQRLEAENRDLTEANAKTRAELEKEHEAIKVFLKKEGELQAQVQKLQGAFEIAEAHARESAAQSKDWENQAADLKKSVDELTRAHASEQDASAQRVKELEEKLKHAGDNQAAGKKAVADQDAVRQRLETENRNLTEANAKARADLDKESEANKVARKKEEELQAQLQKFQGTLEQAEARARESATQSKDWENKAAELKKSVDELTLRHAAEQNAAVKAAQHVKELEEQLKHAGDNQAAGKKAIEDHDTARQRLEAENRNLAEANAKARAELDKEREAIKISQKKEEELQSQLQKLQSTLEQAEVRSREGATQSKDWEHKAADLKKSVEELTLRHAAEQNAAVKAAQRVKELEEQLKHAGDTGKKNIEDHDAARQRLEAENRNLAEANTKAKAELDKEREAIKISQKKEEELQSQLQKLQSTLEQAEVRSREGATQSKDWELKAADLKKSVEELTRRHATEQNAAVKASQRVKELEEQLKHAGDTGKKQIEDQNAARQRLEAENRNLAEANAKAAAELDKEREAIKVSRKKEEELQAQLQKLQGALEQAETRARESAAQSKDWEKKAADLKKSVDELTSSQAAGQGVAAKRVNELEQQLKRAGDDLANSQAENRKLSESSGNQAALEKKASELEERTRWSVFSLKKANAELESQRVEREQAEKTASSAIAQLKELQEKLKRQVDSERAGQSKIAELEKIIQDRGDAPARASEAVWEEAGEQQTTQKQSRLVSEMGKLLESKLAAFEETKRAFEESLREKERRLQIVERSLADAKSILEKESARSRRVEGILIDARLQREKFSMQIFTEASQMFSDGLYSDCHELMKELMGTLDENVSIFNDAFSLHTRTLTQLGRYGEAKAAAQLRIKSIEDRLGKKHPSLISPLNNLVAILERTGFVFEAEQAMRRVACIQNSI